jgi:hypothetical protein
MRSRPRRGAGDRRIDSTVEHARPRVEVVEGLGEVLHATRSGRASTRPAVGAASPSSSARHRRLARAVDADDPDPVAGPSRQVACESRVRSPRTRSTSSTSSTSLPSRWVAKRCSSSRSARRRLVVDQRVGRVDPELRLGGARRRAHGAARRAPCGPGCDGVPRTPRPAAAARPARARTRRSRRRRTSTTPSCTSQVCSHTASRNHRSWVTTTSAEGRETRCSASQATASTSSVVGRLVEDHEVVLVEQELGQGAAPAFAPGEPDHGPVELDPGEELGDHLSGAWLGGPGMVGLAGEDGVAHRVRVVQGVALVEVADGEAARLETPAGVRRLLPGEHLAAASSCRRRCGRPRRRARPRTTRATRR